MDPIRSFSRRAFLAASAALPALLRAADSKEVPVGLELYSVRDELKNDLPGTLNQVAKMGYQCVEFYAPYYKWSSDQAKTVRKQLDELGVRCYSTHNDSRTFTADGLPKAIELNTILGAKYVVMAHPGGMTTADDWKRTIEKLNQSDETLGKSGMHAGYHNHDLEWKALENGQKPIEMIAAGTPKSVMLQLDVGTCVASGNDPVAWIDRNPGRIRSLHLKDWSPELGYKAVFGEGSAPWKQIFRAAESTGGVEYYLIEQEGSRYPAMQTARICLENWRKLRS